MTRPGREPATYRKRGRHSNPKANPTLYVGLQKSVIANQGANGREAQVNL